MRRVQIKAEYNPLIYCDNIKMSRKNSTQKVEILITDVQIDRGIAKLAIIGVKVKVTRGKKVDEWTKAYKIELDQEVTLESFNERLQDDIRKDILIENRIGEVLQQEGKPYTLNITL